MEREGLAMKHSRIMAGGRIGWPASRLLCVACLGIGVLAGSSHGETVNFGNPAAVFGTYKFDGASGSEGNEPSTGTLLRMAQARLNQVRLSHWSELEENGAYQSAKDNLLASRRRLETARQAVLTEVYHSSDYRKMRRAISEREEAMEELRKQPVVDRARIYQAARELLELRSALTKVVSAACAGEQEINSAKESLVDAYATMTQLRHQHESALQSDPQWVDAKNRLEEARKNSYQTRTSGRAVAMRSGGSRSFPVGVVASRQLSLHR